MKRRKRRKRKQGHTDADMFFYLLIVFSSISSLYTLIWDLRMDWGLFDRGAGENTFLREEIVYPHKMQSYSLNADSTPQDLFHGQAEEGEQDVELWGEQASDRQLSAGDIERAYYYCAIIEDVILRFAWTIQISLSTTTKIHSVGDIVSTVLAPMEVFRRFVWNFFRLENEHLNNCGEFRAVRDISVAPLNADDQTLLEQMMDSEEGVRNRSGKKTWKRSYSLSLRRPLLGTSLSKKDTKVLIEDTDDEAFS
ncbi:Xenotropic and polytropic retrovirus receptor 1 [Dissostichus eleginoides]|nr:Xenotropic and polytropic retrovirus receptor 1 [Dissostichus eleginoides]